MQNDGTRQMVYIIIIAIISHYMIIIIIRKKTKYSSYAERVRKTVRVIGGERITLFLHIFSIIISIIVYNIILMYML